MTGSGGYSTDVRAADPGQTDFETFTHEQLLAMIRHADPETIAPVGDHLGLAVERIARIGADLDRHIACVDWEGASGAAFREWGRHVARATLGLSDYAHSTAKALTHAADTLRTVKRDMPPVPAAAQKAYATLQADPTVRHDPDAHARMARAHTEVEAARIEAADQMRKLAQSYSLSATVIETAESPEYPPVPSPFVPPSQTLRTGAGHYSAATGSGATPPVRNSPGTATGGEAERNIAAAPGIAASPLTRTQSTGAQAPAVPTQPGPQPNGNNGNGGGAFVGVSHAGNAPQPFTSGALLHDHSRDAGESATTGQLPRNFPRQELPKAPYEPGSGLFPARGGRSHGIVGGSPAVEPVASGGPGQGPAAYSVVGEYGPATRPPVGGMMGSRTAGSGRAASEGSGVRRLAGEPGGVAGRVPSAEFAPRALGSAGAAREESDGPRHRAELAGEGDWGPRRDDVVPPVIR
ncbi:WXG100 family type VII secretion target [Streptomyces sp. NRRL F-5123]|uniref:WXG100 family type VII secretion target n=1 Tax=Streptomyces sp. NRRL F-5123 TaxID=1463856 RepID=UPI0004E16AA1|nr:hypothetical protein [Streptomyces sp. NRRL F-5123]